MPNSGPGRRPESRVMPIFGPMLPPSMQILIDEIFLTWPYGHLRANFWSFISELVTRNPTMAIPALEDGLFANLLIYDYLYYIFLFGLSASKMTLAFLIHFGRCLLVHTLDTPLQTQTHTQACGGGGGGGVGCGDAGSGGGSGGGDGGGAGGGVR